MNVANQHILFNYYRLGIHWNLCIVKSLYSYHCWFHVFVQSVIYTWTCIWYLYIYTVSVTVLFCRTPHRPIWCSTLRKASLKRVLKRPQRQKMTRRNPQFQQLQIRIQMDRNWPIRRNKLLNYVRCQLCDTSFFLPVSTSKFLLLQSYLIPNRPKQIQNCWHFITYLLSIMTLYYQIA